jgi:hypothetical protein
MIKHTTTLTPATDTVGVKYYYAVITYAGSEIITSGQSTSVPGETVTNPARIEVVAPPSSDLDFKVRNVDEKGTPLAGAVISLVPQDAKDAQDMAARTYEVTTGTDGYASFTVEEGDYLLSEKQAPTGYNATDEKYYIMVTPNEILIYDPATRFSNQLSSEPYQTVTFVNKPIPQLEKEKHFAYMQGYPEGDFRQTKNMTRAEAVVMFSRLLVESMDLTTDYFSSEYYPDIKVTDWYANQVCYMYYKGVLADYSSDGRFRPNDAVTRAEFATLAAHFDNLALTSTNTFPDVPSSHWAVKYINSAAAKGWITGYPDGTFRPEALIIRAEVVTLVNRMLERTADSAYLEANAASLPRSYWDLSTDYWAYLAIMEASMGHNYTKDAVGEHWTSFYQ